MKKQSIGFTYWASRIPGYLKETRRGLSPVLIHDLRVALRRTLSMVEGLQSIRPHPAWKKLRSMGESLFRSLSDLRDIQVMRSWVSRLLVSKDPHRQDTLNWLQKREAKEKKRVQAVFNQFPIKTWEHLIRELAAPLAKLPIGSSRLQVLAEKRLGKAYQFHMKALRKGTAKAYHRLRIRLKNFRYAVENFLPQQHSRWGGDLKRLHDSLGDYHDLHVLEKLLRNEIPALSQKRGEGGLCLKIEREKEKRLLAYERLTTGKKSLWRRWRAGL